jgi:putative transposase
MTYPLVTDLAADGIPVAVTCQVLGFLHAGLLRLESSAGHPT